jgi:hypothetical protein
VRNNSARVGALYLSLLALAALSAALSVSCAVGKCRSQKLTDGTTIRWTPAEPKLGDLVTLEALSEIAVSRPESRTSGTVRDPSGSAIDPVATDFTDGSHAAKKVRWSFRVTAAGLWNFDDGEKLQALWNAATVAGKENELKKFDGESLWHGPEPKPLATGGAPAASASPVQGVTP